MGKEKNTNRSTSLYMQGWVLDLVDSIKDEGGDPDSIPSSKVVSSVFMRYQFLIDSLMRGIPENIIQQVRVAVDSQESYLPIGDEPTNEVIVSYLERLPFIVKTGAEMLSASKEPNAFNKGASANELFDYILGLDLPKRLSLYHVAMQV